MCIRDRCYIEPPLHANWGGHHVHFGNRVYANFNLTLVDDTPVSYTHLVMAVALAGAADFGTGESAYVVNKPVICLLYTSRCV